MNSSDRNSWSSSSSDEAGLSESSDQPQSDNNNENLPAEPANAAVAAQYSIQSATELIDNVAAAESIFGVAELAFIEKPVFFTFGIRNPNTLTLRNVKADVDGWKVSFAPSGNQGYFDFIKVSQDPEVILFRRPKPIPRLLWKDSSRQGAFMRDISRLAGLRIGRMNR